jgi:hypothetical protein
MKLFELLSASITLLESRIDYTAKQYNQKLLDRAKEDPSYNGEADSLEIVKELVKADPENGKNIQFIVRMYLKGLFKMEDCKRLHDDIEKFLKFKSKMEVKDLNAYKTLNDFYDAIEKFSDKDEPVSGKEAARQIKKDAVKVFDEPGFLVLHPKTKDAACFYGSGTKWCTAARENNQFNYYSNQGDLYILIVDLGGKQRKFQLHYESDQFMDERDQEVSKADIAELSKLPAYTDFLNFLIKKHYEPAILALKGETK